LTRAGDQPERIAHKLHLSVDDVTSAVRNFEAARIQASSELVDMLINTEVMTAVDGVGKDIQLARQALRRTGYQDDLGVPIMEPDFATRLDAIRVAGELVDKVRPKGGGTDIKIGINNAGHGDGSSNGQGRSFEAMVRMAEQKRKLELGDGSPATVDAEFVENPSADADELDNPDDAGLDEDDED